MTVKYIVINKDKPPFWPENWEFPMKKAWPPSWPRKWQFTDSRIHAEWDGKEILVQTIDNYDEISKQADGKYLSITAIDSEDNAVRLRKPDSIEWAEEILAPIHDGELKLNLEFDRERANGEVRMEISFYGYYNGPDFFIGV